MTELTIKERLESMTDNQIARMNQNLMSKVYDESNYSLTPSQENEADDLANDINGLSQFDLDELNVSMSSGRKLSTRPC